MRLKLSERQGLATGLLLLGGCTVYAPTIPSTPLVEKGQVEITAGSRALVGLEAGAAWSPAPHLLLAAEGAYQARGEGSYTTSSGTVTYEDYHHQGGVGIGYYRTAGEEARYYLAALGGVGFASVSLHDQDVRVGSVFFPFPLPYPGSIYEARYRRYYGQLYAAESQSRRFTQGLSVRGTWVDYQQLLVDGQPLEPANHLFLEPTYFVRLGRRAFQGQVTVGWSVPLRRDGDNPTVSKTAPASLLLGGGVVFRPHLLKRRR